MWRAAVSCDEKNYFCVTTAHFIHKGDALMTLAMLLRFHLAEFVLGLALAELVGGAAICIIVLRKSRGLAG